MTPRVFVAFATLLCASSAGADEVMTKELKQLQGTWQAVRIEVEGKQSEEAAKQTRVVIEGTRLTWQVKDGSYPYALMVNPKTDPKTLEWKGTRKVLDLEREETYLAIYSLNGDELKLCTYLSPKVFKERPKEFKTAKGSDTGLWEFKRVR